MLQANALSFLKKPLPKALPPARQKKTVPYEKKGGIKHTVECRKSLIRTYYISPNV